MAAIEQRTCVEPAETRSTSFEGCISRAITRAPEEWGSTMKGQCRETRIPWYDSCEAFGTEDLSCFYVVLDGAGGISLICATCVRQAEVRPAYRIVRAPTEDLGL